MTYVVIDTDVASQILRDRLPSALAKQLVGKTLCTSFVTVAELTQWTELRHWGPRSVKALDQWLDSLLVLPHDENAPGTGIGDIARKWGQISARNRGRGRARPQNDTWIAACCLVYGLPLATLNVKDFADFAEYEGLEILTG